MSIAAQSFKTSSVKTNLAKSMTIAGGVVTIADVAQPVAPFAAYIMAFSALASVALGATKLLYKNWGESLTISSYLTIGLFVLSTLLFVYQTQNENSEKLGVLSSKLKSLQKLQNSLGMIEQKLSSIDSSLKSVDKKMDNVKKEVSNDPIKELANMGIPWDGEKFFEAIKNKDQRVIKLFFDGGMQIDRIGNKYNGFTILTSIIFWPKDNWKSTLITAAKNGYDFNTPVYYQHKADKASPLHVAFLLDRWDIASFFIDWGIDKAPVVNRWQRMKKRQLKKLNKKILECKPVVRGGLTYSNHECARYNNETRVEANKAKKELEKINRVLKLLNN